jgi:hypothetical protein
MLRSDAAKGRRGCIASNLAIRPARACPPASSRLPPPPVSGPEAHRVHRPQESIARVNRVDEGVDFERCRVAPDREIKTGGCR